MKNIIRTFVVMGFLCSSIVSFCTTSAFAAQAENNSAINEMMENYGDICNEGCFEEDQGQSDMDRIEELKNFEISNQMSAEDIYKKVLNNLEEMQELSERLGVNERMLFLKKNDLSEKTLKKLLTIFQSNRAVKLEEVTRYLTPDSSSKYTEQEVYTMSNIEWEALVSLYNISKERKEFLRNAQKAEYLSFSLNR